MFRRSDDWFTGLLDKPQELEKHLGRMKKTRVVAAAGFLLTLAFFFVGFMLALFAPRPGSSLPSALPMLVFVSVTQGMLLLSTQNQILTLLTFKKLRDLQSPSES